MKNNRISLAVKTFIYFIFFAFLIVIIFWILEIGVLDQFYAESKKKACYDVAEIIENNLQKYDYIELDFNKSEIIAGCEELESNNEMSIWLIHKNPKNDLFSIIFGNTLNPVTMTNLWKSVANSALNEKFLEKDSIFWFSKLIKIKDGTEILVLLECRIVPVEPIVEIWRRQFFIISLVVVLLTAIFATVVSRRISRPISSLNKAAKVLAKGKYDTLFEASDYAEIEELADTLNYASKELGKLDRYQKELIANVSHDLRTPLTLISGYSEMMLDYPSEMKKENIEIIVNETKRLVVLVNDILDLTKMQSDTTSYTKENYNLTKNIEEIINRNAKMLAAAKCDVHFERDSMVFVYADIRKIEMVLYNFLSNAINYCGDDRQVIVRQVIERSFVKISFIDHGIGIDEQYINDIWNRYYKVDKVHHRGIGGSGIGLSIVKAVLEAHNFEYGVNSKVGSGSEFWFKMPIIKVLECDDDEK